MNFSLKFRVDSLGKHTRVGVAFARWTFFLFIGLQTIKKFKRANMHSKFYESENFSDSFFHRIFESENFRFPFSAKNG